MVSMESVFQPGGVVKGSIQVRMVPEERPAVGGELAVMYADECIVGSNGLCRRSDTWHRTVRIASERPWVCLAHD